MVKEMTMKTDQIYYVRKVSKGLKERQEKL